MCAFFNCLKTGPLLQSSCAPKRYTSGHWSLTRPSVFYIGREDGYIDIWDLLEKTHEPAQSQNICVTMITSIKPWAFSSMLILIKCAESFSPFCVTRKFWHSSRKPPVLFLGFFVFFPFLSLSSFLSLLLPHFLPVLPVLSCHHILDTTWASLTVFFINNYFWNIFRMPSRGWFWTIQGKASFWSSPNNWFPLSQFFCFNQVLLSM